MQRNDPNLPPAPKGAARFRPTDATSFAGDPEDTLTHLASALKQALNVSIAYVALPEEGRLVLIGHLGEPGGATGWREMPMERSVCAAALAVRETVMVDDLSVDGLFTPSAELEEVGAVAFAAVPLGMPDGEMVGALCVGQAKKRAWSRRDRAVLTHMAAAAALILRHRSTIHAAATLAQSVAGLDGPLKALTDQVRRLTTMVAEHDDPRVRRTAALAGNRVQEVERLMHAAHAAARRTVKRSAETNVELTGLVRRSVSSAANVSGSEQFRFDPKTPALMVRGDPLELEHSLTALLLTVAEYAAGTNEIHLRLIERKLAVLLDIIDLGLGVPAAELVRMLSRFRVGAESTAGTLHLVGGVVFADRGIVRARSSARGTAFRITLPHA